MHVDPEVTARRDEGLALRMQCGTVDAVAVGLDDLQGRGWGLGFTVTDQVSEVTQGDAVLTRRAKPERRGAVW